jgi:uncharacterized membrane protein
MVSPASINGHPIHPMLISFPIGLWVFSLLSDVVPGLIDLLSLSDPKAKTTGIWHMVINLLVVGLFALNLWLRLGSAPGSSLPLALSAIGVILLCISGWLGGELVFKHGVAVEPQPDTKPGGRDVRAV